MKHYNSVPARPTIPSIRKRHFAEKNFSSRVSNLLTAINGLQSSRLSKLSTIGRISITRQSMPLHTEPAEMIESPDMIFEPADRMNESQLLP